MHPAFQGSKRKARLRAKEAEQSRAFDEDLQRLAALAQELESDEQLDAMLAREIPNLEARAAVRTLVLALRDASGPRIEIATGAEDIRNAVRNPSGNRKLLIPTASGPSLVLES